jgi:nucleotide-binding universal stress UspA family protein
MKTILVPIDFSEGTPQIIQQAVTLAKAFSSMVYLVHIELPNEDISGKEIDQTEDEFSSEAKKLNQLAQAIRQEDIETHAILAQGVATIAILDEIEKVDADLIVMGTHGHGVISSALLGGVSQGIVKKAKCPVLLVPTKDS